MRRAKTFGLLLHITMLPVNFLVFVATLIGFWFSPAARVVVFAGTARFIPWLAYLIVALQVTVLSFLALCFGLDPAGAGGRRLSRIATVDSLLLTLIAAVLCVLKPDDFWIGFLVLTICYCTLNVTALRALRQHRRDPSECPACGYDLTGNESGICPECGAEVRRAVTA